MMSDSLLLKERLKKIISVTNKIYLSKGWKYSSYEELVLSCGTEMEGIPFTPTIKRELSQGCYANCYNLMLILKQKNLVYVEGYAFDKDIDLPISHAWLMTPEGKAVDPTWKEPADYYLGIPMSFQWVKAILNGRKKNGEIPDYSILQGNYLEKFSLLKEGIPPEGRV